MKRKVFMFLGIVALLVSIMPVHNVLAWSTLYKGLDINTSHDGLRALISTGNAGGSPPTFSFTSFSPDNVDQDWVFRIYPAYSCVEAGTEFWRQIGGATTAKFYVVDTCNGTYVYSISVTDATWRGKYARTNTWNDTGTSFQDENYDVRIIKPSALPSWQVQLYNYSTSTWDFVVNVSGTGASATGAVEFVDNGGTQQATGKYCPTLYAWNVLQMRGLQRRLSGTWYTIGSGDISYYNDIEYCFTNNTYKITTPQPYQWKMLPYGASY